MNHTYHVSYYGLLGEYRGLGEEIIASEVATPAALYQLLHAQHHLKLAISDLRAAVNDEFVPWQHPLKDHDRIAFLPPMSGG